MLDYFANTKQLASTSHTFFVTPGTVEPVTFSFSHVLLEDFSDTSGFNSGMGDLDSGSGLNGGQEHPMYFMRFHTTDPIGLSTLHPTNGFHPQFWTPNIEFYVVGGSFSHTYPL